MTTNTSTFQIRTERVRGLSSRRFRSGGKVHHTVRIYLEASPADLDGVRSVQYKLHPTFRDRFRVSTDRRTAFEIIIWTYGFFDVTADVIMKDATVQTVEGEVKWD